MGSLSIWHWVIVLLVVMVLFGGRGKISSLMGDFAQGIKAFKKGMSDDDKAEPDTAAKDTPVRTIDHNRPDVTNAASEMKTRADAERKVEGGTI
jgi:sec-independent protein translocase protein TatA